MTMPVLDYQVALEASRAYRRCARTLESLGLKDEAAPMRACAQKYWNEHLRLAAKPD